jgi:hypothetical protein
MSSPLDRMMPFELREVIKAKDARIRELEQEVAKLKNDLAGHPYYCTPVEGKTCENKVPIAYERTMADGDHFRCPKCDRLYVANNEWDDGFVLSEVDG